MLSLCKGEVLDHVFLKDAMPRSKHFLHKPLQT